MDLVSGYIRLAAQNFDLICPSLIITTCILFYHLHEMFTVYGSYMTVDKLGKVLNMQKEYEPKPPESNTAYGNLDIDDKYQCIYTWTVKIIIKHIYDVRIGIDL